jgi:hypothetical protein
MAVIATNPSITGSCLSMSTKVAVALSRIPEGDGGVLGKGHFHSHSTQQDQRHLAFDWMVRRHQNPCAGMALAQLRALEYRHPTPARL